MSADAVPADIPQRPLPAPDASTEPYWAAAREGRLVMPRCIDCGHFHFYPKTLCPACSSPRLEWTACSGRAEVYSYTVVHRAPSPAFAADVPYVVAAIALEEGPHLMSSVINCPPDAVHVGMPVRVAFRRASDEITLPVFEPIEEGAWKGQG
jgi:uncharacterized OB-fold protein